jgi:hypothetical protein
VETAEPSLSTVERTFEIDRADTTCPSCGVLAEGVMGDRRAAA